MKYLVSVFLSAVIGITTSLFLFYGPYSLLFSLIPQSILSAIGPLWFILDPLIMLGLIAVVLTIANKYLKKSKTLKSVATLTVVLTIIWIVVAASLTMYLRVQSVNKEAQEIRNSYRKPN